MTQSSSEQIQLLLGDADLKTTQHYLEAAEVLVVCRRPAQARAHGQSRRSDHRRTGPVQFRHGTFEYTYDHYTALEATGQAPYDPTAESRLVAVCGISAPRQAARDDYRLRGWVGPTGRSFGAGWDKGHFIAHSIGGAVDGVEANVFVQRRDLNRGWSAAGKRFRSMESYCLVNPERSASAVPSTLMGRRNQTNRN